MMRADDRSNSPSEPLIVDFRARACRLVPRESYDHLMTHPLCGAFDEVVGQHDGLCRSEPIKDMPFWWWEQLELNLWHTAASRERVQPYHFAFGLALLEWSLLCERPVNVASVVGCLLLSAVDFPEMVPSPELSTVLSMYQPFAGDASEAEVLAAGARIASIVQRSERTPGWAQEIAALATAMVRPRGGAERLLHENFWAWLCDPEMIVRPLEH
jgi:hypothetical protein